MHKHPSPLPPLSCELILHSITDIKMTITNEQPILDYSYKDNPKVPGNFIIQTSIARKVQIHLINFCYKNFTRKLKFHLVFVLHEHLFNRSDS